MFLSSSRDKFLLLKQNSVTNVSVGFVFCWRRHVGAHSDGHQHGVSIIISLNLKLGESLYLLSFPRFWTLSIERFWFLFWSILNGVTLKTSNSKLLTLTLTLIRSPLYLYFSDKFRVALKWRGKLFALSVMPTLHVAYMHFRTTY